MRRTSAWGVVGLAVFALLFAAGCGQDESDTADSYNPPDDDDAIDDDDDSTPLPDDSPDVSDPVTVVPSSGLPPQAVLQEANNNLDVVEHEGQIFLAFRTAPSHFASRDAQLHVVRSANQQFWIYETSFSMGADLREPRLLSFDGRLFLYFAVLGTNPLNFEPQGMMASEYLGPGNWTEPEYFYGEGFIPWRAKVIDGVPYLVAYVGGGGIYDLDPEPMQVHWLTTDDGVNFEPVVPGQPVVLEGGGSETDFVFLDDGALVAVVRNEMGDASGWGSNLCRAEADSLGQWNCVNDPRKYDSPLMFRHGADVYILGRRNLNGSGYYDLGYDDLPITAQHLLYELEYWLFPKRTSLWKLNPETLDVSWVLDLPSRGDTCFPGLIRESDDRFMIYNYTSPLDGPDVAWVAGQLGPTSIVRTALTFPSGEDLP